MMGIALPTICEHALGLVARCVKFENSDAGYDIDDLPHWLIAPIVEAWLVENFGEERKWRPWKAAIERAIQSWQAVKPSGSTLPTQSESSPLPVST